MPSYSISVSEAHFDEHPLTINAPDANEAILTFVLQGIQRASWRTYLYVRTVDTSFAAHFWIQSAEEAAYDAAHARPMITRKEFERRVRSFFKHDATYTKTYLEQYFNGVGDFSIAMQMYMYLHFYQIETNGHMIVLIPPSHLPNGRQARLN